MQPIKHSKPSSLKSAWFNTPLGPMIAIADKDSLHLLEFKERKGLNKKIEKLYKEMNAAVTEGVTPLLKSIKNDLTKYFKGELQKFKIRLNPLGTELQKLVWKELQKIPSGETKSYSEIARAIGKPTAQRAVANAIGKNPIAIVIPCHRVIAANGGMGGYAGGIKRKKWLLSHER